MKIRTSETEHAFQSALYERLNAFSIQGLLMDNENNFTALIEAVEFEENDTIETPLPFTDMEIKAKMALAYSLGLPFYLITYFKPYFFIYEYLVIDNKICRQSKARFNEDQFANWWARLKKKEFKTNHLITVARAALTKLFLTLY